MNNNQTSEAGETPSQTIYLLMTETVDVGGIVERFARDAYMNRTDAEAEKAKLEAGDKEREAKRMAAGRSCGAVYSYTIDECELIGSATESHLRAQLAEAEKWRDWHELQAQRIMIQRDAAQARVAALEPVLVKAKERLLFWKGIAESHGLGHQETCGVCKMIDAALATSPHRLAGRGDQ